MSHNSKLIAVTAAVALAAGGGAAFAGVELARSGPSASPAAPAVTSQFGAGSGALGVGGGDDFGAGRYGRGGPDDGGPGRFGGGLFGNLGAAATYLGVSTSTLQSEIQNGKTLAQVAKAHGKPVAGLVAALVAAERKQLDAAVSAGTLTRAQEQQLALLLGQRVKDLVDGTRTGRDFGPGFRFGGGGDDGGGGGRFGPGGGSGGTGSFGGATA